MVQDPKGADYGACLAGSNSGMFHGGPESLFKGGLFVLSIAK